MNSQVYDKLPKDVQIGDVFVGWNHQIWGVAGWEVLRVIGSEVFRVRNIESGTIIDNYSVYDSTLPFQLLMQEQPYDPTQAGDKEDDI